MGNKKITDLQPRLSVTSGLNFPGDDGTQTWRVTAQQILDFVQSGITIANANIADEAVSTNKLSTTLQGIITGKITNPMTTGGDVIYGGTSGAPTRLANGSAGQFLKSQGTTLAPVWSFGPSILAKTTTFTASVAEDIYSCGTSGGAYTATLPTAVGNTNKIFYFIKTTNDFNALTIDANSTETINGLLTIKLNVQWESVKIISDGTNWIILDRVDTSKLLTYTATVTGLTVNTTDFRWKKIQDEIYIRGRFITSSTAATEMRISLPSGLVSASTIPGIFIAGKGARTSANGSLFNAFVPLIETSQSYMTFSLRSTTANELTKQNGSALFSNTETGEFTAQFPIQGWDT